MSYLWRLAMGWLWPPLGYQQRLAELLEWERAQEEDRPLTLLRDGECRKPYGATAPSTKKGWVMDHFGIGAAMQGVAGIYFRSARQTGRTTSLVESVKNGDRIVFADSKEAERVRRMCLARGVDVECVVVEPSNPGRVFDRGPSKGRTLFDHAWVEQHYLHAIEHAQAVIDDIERRASGRGEARKEPPPRPEWHEKWRV